MKSRKMHFGGKSYFCILGYTNIIWFPAWCSLGYFLKNFILTNLLDANSSIFIRWTQQFFFFTNLARMAINDIVQKLEIEKRQLIGRTNTHNR